MDDVTFLTFEETIYIHQKQIDEKGGASDLLSKDKLEGAIGQPRQTFDGEYLNDDLFEMAAVYIISIVDSHPFMDGNKRTGLHAALTFLYMNGYEIEESHDEELACMIYDYIEGKIEKEGMADFLAKRALPVEG